MKALQKRLKWIMLSWIYHYGYLKHNKMSHEETKRMGSKANNKRNND